MSHKREISISGSGIPTSIAPEFIGQIYKDIISNKSYIAKSLVVGDWEAIVPKLNSEFTQYWLKSDIGGVNEDTYFYCMAVYKEKLYVGTYNSNLATNNTGAKLFVYDGSSWSIITKADIGAHANDVGFVGMCIYNNKLYVGTQNMTLTTDSTGAKVCVYDGSSWSIILKSDIGAHANDNIFYGMCVYSNKLYIGTYNATAATDVTAAKVCVYDGSSWSVILKSTMGGVNADTLMISMAIYNNKLYVGCYNNTAATNNTSCKLFVYDSASWSIITKATMGGHNNDIELSAMAVYGGRLYVVTSNTVDATDITACKILVLSNTSWASYYKSDTLYGVANDNYLKTAIVYNGKLIVPVGFNDTGAVDMTGSKLFIYDGTWWGALSKSALYGHANDRGWYSCAIYKNKLFLGTRNDTLATDITASKVIAIQLGTFENENNYTQRGF